LTRDGHRANRHYIDQHRAMYTSRVEVLQNKKIFSEQQGSNGINLVRVIDIKSFIQTIDLIFF